MSRVQNAVMMRAAHRLRTGTDRRTRVTVAVTVLVALTACVVTWLGRSGPDAPDRVRYGPLLVQGSSPSPASVVPSASASTGASRPAKPPATGRAGGAPIRVPDTLHFISNVGAARPAVAALGFNLFDMGTDREAIDALPAGALALVWLGNLDNTDCTPRYSFAEFTAAVDRLAGDRKVFGYYLSDEPHPSICPQAVAHIRQRADYIRSRDPAQRSFIVVLNPSRMCPTDPGCEYRQLRPADSHVDLVGVDMFPCNADDGCVLDEIDRKVKLAESAGIPASAIVPVFQAFGQSCTGSTPYYTLPDAGALRAIIGRWHALLPHPVFEFTYTWQSGGSACPALDAANGASGRADLQAVLRAHNNS